ncbi:hypothetical protein [Maioricimonas sp. JC845]|uniref:hypothetical protein n=1 Tax=Maioricimonas sp. JC845 TaxID=3232138 RepID=UPI003457A90D
MSHSHSALVLAAGLLFAAIHATPSAVHGADDERQRVQQGFAFVSQMLDREIVSVTDLKYYQGTIPYADRSRNRRRPVIAGMTEATGTLSSDRIICRLELVEPFPVTEDSFLIKLIMSNGRKCKINYVGADCRSEIRSFTERPLDEREFEDTAALVGSGVWYGYLLSKDLPEFSELVEQADWSPGEGPREVVGLHGDRRIRIQFDEDVPERPNLVEITYADPSREKVEPYALHSRVIELSDWGEMSGIELPRKVLAWDLGCNFKGEPMTFTASTSLVGLGPPIGVSQRYGDYFTDIPDGTPVQVNDYMGIDFVWDDGEIVRKIDRRTLRSLIDQPFFESPVRRLLMMALGGAAVAVAGLLLWRQRSRG